MTIYIKNMVCNRCILVVRQEIEKLDFAIQTIKLGEVTLLDELDSEKLGKIADVLEPLGFELIDDKKSQLIERIKTIVIKWVREQDGEHTVNLSDVLAGELHHDYNYLSNLFSEVEGVTIEKYHIAQKIELVKELLVYDELSLSEIADQLGYSSVAYLSNQFKKVTGLTPSHFKQIKEDKRKPLDEV
ncbi:helix-turn-helix domain-containing protein [Sphingobacterium micropteri]|nr:AraC family transcriptional regulator [Sphingobacterium micropteri]